MNLPYILSDANFVLFQTKEDDMQVFNLLMRKGYIIRPGSFLNLPGFIRVTISTMENNLGFMAAFKEALQEISAGKKTENPETDFLQPTP